MNEFGASIHERPASRFPTRKGTPTMLRAFFLAIGIFCFLVGAECLAVDKAILAPSSDQTPSAFAQHLTPAYREIVPPEWAPWSLMSVGAVVVLYSFTIPLKLKS